MTKEKLERLIEVANQVSEDVERDAKDFDGKPFTGKTMAEYMGNHGAAIKALSEILLVLLKKKLEERR